MANPKTGFRRFRRAALLPSISCAVAAAWFACGRNRTVTFVDVAPVIHRRCAPCHRPGEVAPFPLLSFADVQKRASQIARVTTERYMPPWKPVPGFGRFRDDRSLSPDEIDLLRRWAAAGAP